MGVPMALNVLSGDSGERVVYGDTKGAVVLLLCGSRELPARDLISTEQHKVGAGEQRGLRGAWRRMGWRAWGGVGVSGAGHGGGRHGCGARKELGQEAARLQEDAGVLQTFFFPTDPLPA